MPIIVIFLSVLFTLALPFLMFWYAKKQYLAIRTMRGGWQVLAWLPVARVGYLLVDFVISVVTPPLDIGLVAINAGFSLGEALLFLYLLSIAHGALRRDQNIPSKDRHMHRAAEIGKAVAWAVGVAWYMVVALIVFGADFWLLLALLFLSLLSIAYRASAYRASRRDQNIPPEDRHMRRAAEIGKAAARVVGVAAFVVLVVLVLIIKVPGWLDPGKQRDADDCSQSGDLDRRIDACTRLIGGGGGSARCPAWAPCSRRNLIAAYNNRGAAYADKGDHDRAIADYKELIGLDPKAAYAAYNRGLATGRKDDYDRAIAEFDEAIRLDPNNALLLNALLILHSFAGGADDGRYPRAGLIFDPNGALYGTTESGGSRNGGTAFTLTPSAAGQTLWTETVLHSFTGGTDGYGPEGSLIFDGNGALYAAASSGGSSYTGTVFKLTPPAAGQTQWTKTVLHNFTGGLEGGRIDPNGLIFDGNGALYGTTYFGGSRNGGTVFKLTPPAAGQTLWTHTVLHSFTGGNDGYGPKGSLIFDGDGALYGTTERAGSEKNGGGTVFKLTPPAAGQTQWSETVLYSFSPGTGGWGPNGSLIFDRNGALYGTTMLGGRVSLSFLGPNEGYGTVFKLTPPAAGQTQWTHTVLYSFTGENGEGGPHAGLIFDGDGALYGTTTGGGWGHGTVYKLTPPAAGQTQWTETVLHSFTGGTDGSGPHGSLIFDGNGALYGTTVFGGKSNMGTVFKLTGTKH